jgi:DNA-binding transcriptional regulator YiaG
LPLRGRKKEGQAMLDELAPAWLQKGSTRRAPSLEQLQRARREERLARYEQVIALRKQALSCQVIASRVGMGASTVQSWLAVGAFPERKPREQSNLLDRSLPYVVDRWEQGCHNMTQISQELLARGYKGSYASVYGNLVRHFPSGRKHASGTDRISPAPPACTTSDLSRASHRSEKLSNEEQETRRMLRQFHPEVDLAYDLVQQFVQMLRTRQGECLDTWLAQVNQSNIRRHPVLYRRSRERQRCSESRAYLVDQ